MAEESGREDKKLWLAGVGTALTLAAFFGIHNFSDLKAKLSGTGGAGATQSAAPVPKPAQSTPCLGLWCGQVHFLTSGIQFNGSCQSTGCPVSGTFANRGTVAGQASVTFTIQSGDSSGPRVGACTSPIPFAAKNGVVTASCTIYPSQTLTGNIHLTAEINNPFG
ncbi:hypothetical protein [Kitasatospora sp. McL0602]|uniref:hypothetical protein n=1 Tax=Kitasatospora sp. McL0602 TaxID=3439530 RepID=UPI003F8BC06B